MTGPLVSRFIGQPEPHYTDSLYDQEWNKNYVDGRFHIFRRPGGNLYFVSFRRNLDDVAKPNFDGDDDPQYEVIYAIRVKLKS